MQKTKNVARAAALSLLIAAGTAGAQTTSTTTPGTPNTGLGGDFAQNAIILTASGALAVAGVAFLARRLKAQ